MITLGFNDFCNSPKQVIMDLKEGVSRGTGVLIR